MTDALLGLGSNLGERPRVLRAALRTLARSRSALRIRRCSELFETAPVGGPSQGDYVNAVAWIVTSLAPRALLAVCAEAERRAGRVRGGERNGPRILDLDLLLYGDARLATAELEIPHPRMTERGFVLRPAAQIVPRWVHPVRGTSLLELWRQLSCSA